eukprot:291616-Prorocentrum_minimum.AAC.1
MISFTTIPILVMRVTDPRGPAGASRLRAVWITCGTCAYGCVAHLVVGRVVRVVHRFCARLERLRHKHQPLRRRVDDVKQSRHGSQRAVLCAGRVHT